MIRLPRTRGYLLVLAATLLWSSLGPLTKTLLDQFHVPSISIAFLRCLLASSTMFVLLAAFRRDLIKAPPAAIWQLIVLGVFGVGGFYAALAAGIQLAGISLLAVLGYLAPTWVSIIGALFLREPFTARKVVSLGLSLAGAALAVKIYDLDAFSLNLPGVIVGLLASFGYAFFAIFSKTLNGKCDPRTMLMYAYGIGAVVLLPFQGSGLGNVLQPATWPLLAAVIAGPTLGAWSLFSLALRRVPVSNATIVTSLDVVFSNILAFVIFGELLQPPQLLGGALILAAMILLQIEPPRREEHEEKINETSRPSRLRGEETTP
jgi:drug/metabolite transporter (DMT)-like permease